ncbi:hypothetical protein FKM82_025903 [Ascaphus truei]
MVKASTNWGSVTPIMEPSFVTLSLICLGCTSRGTGSVGEGGLSAQLLASVRVLGVKETLGWGRSTRFGVLDTGASGVQVLVDGSSGS